MLYGQLVDLLAGLLQCCFYNVRSNSHKLQLRGSLTFNIAKYLVRVNRLADVQTKDRTSPKIKIVFTGISLYRFQEGQIVEIWEYYDKLGLYQQIGVIPAMTQTDRESPPMGGIL